MRSPVLSTPKLFHSPRPFLLWHGICASFAPGICTDLQLERLHKPNIVNSPASWDPPCCQGQHRCTDRPFSNTCNDFVFIGSFLHCGQSAIALDPFGPLHKRLRTPGPIVPNLHSFFSETAPRMRDNWHLCLHPRRSAPPTVLNAGFVSVDRRS